MMSELPPAAPRESFVYNPNEAGSREGASREGLGRGPARARERDRSAPAPGAEAKPNAAPPPAIPPAKDTRRELVGHTVGGRYRVRGVLGEGGMGTVYDAEHLGLSRQVAIKVLSPAQSKKRVAVKRFQQEARAAGAIGHPNICEVYDLGLLEDGSPYLVMEKLVGETLAERIAKEGGLPFSLVVEVVVQVLSGLVAAHEKGIVHRDIKPENIFLARRSGLPPIIKVLDFGVSKMLPEFQTGEDFDLTRTGMVMGTPYYMSPEQARGERNLDGRVDVYACGVVMYEAIVGKRPFLAPNYNALLLAIINSMPRPVREYRANTPPELEAIVMRAMSKNRDDRYPSAKHFLRDLAVPVALPSATPSQAKLAEASASRLPAPPTAEERRRAPVLGGAGRSSPQLEGERGRRLQPSSRPEMAAEAASATLKSGMTEGARPAHLRADPTMAFEDTIRGQRPPLLFPQHRIDVPADSDSIDIPIEVEAPVDELPEEAPPRAAQRPGARMPAALARPPVAIPAAMPPAIPPLPLGPAGRAPSPEPRTDVMEDWDRATVIQHAEAAAVLNPDDTMKLDSRADFELVDVDEPPPPRNPRRR
jgi:serine/threonine-protein kinase